MARAPQFSIGFAVAALAAIAPLAPAAAQSPSLNVDSFDTPPGGTIQVHGRCDQPSGTFQVRLTGTGGSSAVTVTAQPQWTASIPVPWSMQPGSATVTSTCSSPTPFPAGTTIASGLPPAPFPIQVFPGNGYVRVANVLRSERDWYGTAIVRRNGQLDRIVTWSALDTGAGIPAPNGEPIEITVYATNRNGVSAPSETITTAASASGPAATIPSAPQLLATGSNAGRVLATWTSTNDGGSPILGWSMAVAPHGSSQVAASSFVGADVRAASLDQLAPGSYDVYLAAVSARGYGVPATATVTVPTVTTAPTVPWMPADISVQHRSDGLAVGWRATPADGGSPVLAYAVVVVQNGAVVAWQNAGPLARSVVLPAIRGPQPPTVIHVMAANRMGFGVPLTTYTGG